MLHAIRQFCLCAALALIPLAAKAAGLGPLTDPATLQNALGSEPVVVLDIRGTGAYEAGHIPGARSAPYHLFRGPPDNPGKLVSETELTQVLRDLGVTTDRPVVIVHQGSNQTDFGAAARVYWTLKSSGVSQLAILNGGMNGWQAAKMPLRTGAQPSVEPSTIEVAFSDRWLATREDVRAIVDGQDSAQLIDARPEAFWKGEAKHGAAARPGTLPQSRYFTYDRWFGTEKTSLIKPDLIRKLAAENGFDAGDRLVSFCNTGHWAAINWFALSEIAGIDDVRLYPESIVGWSQSGYDMANVPGLFQNLLNKITGKY